jgi:peptidyl-prolyl cis-trans isomerase SurA
MKKLLFCCTYVLCTNMLFAQTLFTYGNSATSKADFLRAYNKNKPSTDNKEKSLREYLELYTNFKLKVKAAEALRLDTLQQIKYDIQNFRDQVVDNYMNDEKGLQSLINEAADRATKDIHFFYFTVPLPEKATKKDSLDAAATATEVYKSIKGDKTNNIQNIGSAIKIKYPTVKFGDAGFITSFSLPYDIENIIYTAKPLDISAPYRSKKGWNLFYVTETRSAIGEWKVAQILFAFPPDVDNSKKEKIKQKADSVYRLIQNGLSFNEAAKLYSDDRITYLSGGEMQPFTTGQYLASFEKNVITLSKDNEVSAVFETTFGYHIARRLSKKNIERRDPNFLADIKQKVTQDTRINVEKEKFIKFISQKIGFKKIITDGEFNKYYDLLLDNRDNNKDSFKPFGKKAIISFKDKTVIKGDEWMQFIINNRPSGEQAKIANKDLLQTFCSQEILNYYKANVENYSPDFKYQMQEFKEGNMLFEIMERNVWSKAGQDSNKLKKYYQEHTEKYKWAESADVMVFNCSDETKAKVALEALKKGTDWKTIAEKSDNQIQADSGRYELSQVPATMNKTAEGEAGDYSDIIKNVDGTYTFVSFLKQYPANIQRSFSDARGLIINDYQNVIEQEWLAVLKKKYPLKINEAVFKEILQ